MTAREKAFADMEAAIARANESPDAQRTMTSGDWLMLLNLARLAGHEAIHAGDTALAADHFAVAAKCRVRFIAAKEGRSVP